MNRQILILIPAAGQSARMRGTDKLMLPVDAEPLLTRQTRRALATGADVLVTLNAAFPDRNAALDRIADPALARHTVADPTEGMAASLRAGAAAARARHAPALMVLLPDLPDLTTLDLAALVAAWHEAPADIHQASAQDGTPGHPVIFPARLLPAFDDLTGDQGARPLMQRERIRRTALPGDRATRDLDTPSAWAEWRNNRQPDP